MENARQRIRVHFDDLKLMRKFRLYVLAYDIQVHSSWIDNAANRGWVECAIDEAEKQTALSLFKCRIVH